MEGPAPETGRQTTDGRYWHADGINICGTKYNGEDAEIEIKRVSRMEPRLVPQSEVQKKIEIDKKSTKMFKVW